MTELTREFETTDAIADAITTYRDREGELTAYFAAPAPDAVVITDAKYDDIDEAYDKLTEWQVVTRRVRELHEAKRRLGSGSSPTSASPIL